MVVGRIVSLTSRNVFTNLAAEQRLFERTSGHMLLFYVNSPCVVMGRTQNPFYEVDVSYAMNHRIPIARRRSGGGTVVHDEGNLNICFIRPRDEHDPCINAKLLAGVLQDEFGIMAKLNKRGDILVDDDNKKVSGSAYRLSRDRAYHHATLLVNSDLTRLRQLLKSPLSQRIDAMGTKSVTSKVANLNDCLSDHNAMDIPSVMQAIANRWQGMTFEKEARIQSLTPSLVEKEVGGMQGERGELCSHKWVFGQSPKFSFHSSHNDGDDDDNTTVQISVKKGNIVDNVIVSDKNNSGSDNSDVAHPLNQNLVGRQFDATCLSNALEDLLLPNNEYTTHYDGIVRAVRRTVADIPPQTWADDGEGRAEEMT